MSTAEQIAVTGDIIYGSLNPEEHGSPYLCVGLTREQIRTIPLGSTVKLTVSAIPMEPISRPMVWEAWVHPSGDMRATDEHDDDEIFTGLGWRRVRVTETDAAGRPL